MNGENVNRHKNVDFDFEVSKPLSFWQRKIPMWLFGIYLAIAFLTAAIFFTSNIIQLQSSKQAEQLKSDVSALKKEKVEINSELRKTKNELASAKENLNTLGERYNALVDTTLKRTRIFIKSIYGNQELRVFPFSNKRAEAPMDTIHTSLNASLNSKLIRHFQDTAKISIHVNQVSANGLAVIFVLLSQEPVQVKVIEPKDIGTVIKFE